MITVAAVEARRRFGDLLNIVSLTGEEVTIARDGKDLARLVPCTPRRAAVTRGKLDFRKAAGLGAEEWRTVDVDEYIRKEREAWD